VTNPGLKAFNWSLYKHFYIHERFDTELRFEFYNVFNQGAAYHLAENILSHLSHPFPPPHFDLLGWSMEPLREKAKRDRF
jgi:hypothetical protein